MSDQIYILVINPIGDLPAGKVFSPEICRKEKDFGGRDQWSFKGPDGQKYWVPLNPVYHPLNRFRLISPLEALARQAE